MHPVRDRCPTERRPAFFAGMLGGLAGAALALSVATFAGRPAAFGPSEALARDTRDGVDERPRGLVSAAEQRIEIIERLDRIVAALERIDRHSTAHAPPAGVRPHESGNARALPPATAR